MINFQEFTKCEKIHQLPIWLYGFQIHLILKILMFSHTIMDLSSNIQEVI